ncbi:reversion-inducing cysteine-rich protein with Kazal motifs [Schistocerca serialis cubense]|uniref:reversion-inducing cysteine-rich protein with Kazal motifs n=1 Tax=Schistocerca serialis cubense TaxID=2023355 RepID=UPI00214E10C7|nr:reversion-inducing cysteine-rich protein with Kazal motifs [Schistocerca serialis cubense]
MRPHVVLTLLLLMAARRWDVVGAAAQDASCCSDVSGSCRTACEQMSLADMAVDAEARAARVDAVRMLCPQQLGHFWECLNRTFEEARRADQWPGRSCCALPQSPLCQQACLAASSRADVTAACRYSDEISFYSCLDIQKAGDECCGSGRTPACREACRAVFRARGVGAHAPPQELLDDACAEHSSRVLTCVRQQAAASPTIDPRNYVPCCDRASTTDCRDACRRILRTENVGLEIVDSLKEAGCGEPLPHDHLWQCFMQSRDRSEDTKQSRIDLLGMDSAKLHCCYKAASSSCRRLCFKTFSKEWIQHWNEFNTNCLQQVSEDRLIHCIDEVEEPCELGCEGLSFCSNFNNRPTELFRSCSQTADEAARYDMAVWLQDGVLGLPGFSLPLLNISQCSAHAWKTVACMLQIKPCHQETHINRICKEDCYALLRQCLDWRRAPGQSAAELCARLSADGSQSPCISLRPFLQPSDSPHVPPQDELTLPCKGDHPCNASQVCQLNRHCSSGHACRTYRCTPGCKLGEVSQYLVPEGTFVRIPVVHERKGCLKICRCSSRGSLESCRPLPCTEMESCWLGNRKIEHNTQFQIECNTCSCFAGEITCSKKQCEISALGDPDPAYTSLPCNCPPHYVPVCARNGNTYPSACLAKCAGLTDAEFEFGPCSAKDPCASHTCSRGQQCIPDRKVCLSMMHKSCRQYKCVETTEQCTNLPYDPVCDTEGQEHHNMCALVRSWRRFAYSGPCRTNCDNNGTVCGADGVTYRSECAAHAAQVPVDYAGPCTAVGQIGSRPAPQCDAVGVRCPPLAAAACLAVTPPGACCPRCAGAVRFLYSQKQVERALHVSKDAALPALTVSAVLSALERQVQVSECAVRGYLSVEADLVAVVEARRRPPPSRLQLEACAREALKLAALVRRASPRVLSELPLSVLVAAAVAHAPAAAASAASALAPASAAALTLAAAACALSVRT